MTKEERRIKTKIYNRFIELLEEAESYSKKMDLDEDSKLVAMGQAMLKVFKELEAELRPTL